MKVIIKSNNPLGKEIETDMNPLDVAETWAFKHKIPTFSYRERALDICLKSNVQFNSTVNNLQDMAKMLLSCKCPYCKQGMNCRGGGGSSTEGVVDFYCACGSKVTLTMPWSGINVQPAHPIE